MLTVDENEVIRRDYFIHRKSMRQIARERHHSRKTIRKAIYDPGVPIYTRSKPRPQAAIGPFQEVLRQWLQEDQQRPVKQRHTARRVFQRLQEEYGYPGSERSVRRGVSALRGTIPDSHVPQTYAPADGGTFDFGEALVKLGGRETRVHLGCLRPAVGEAGSPV